MSRMVPSPRPNAVAHTMANRSAALSLRNRRPNCNSSTTDRKDNIPSKMKMEIGKPQSDSSVVVTMTPQGAITGHEFVKARGGTPYRLDTGGDGIFDPFQEDGKNSKSPSKK